MAPAITGLFQLYELNGMPFSLKCAALSLSPLGEGLLPYKPLVGSQILKPPAEWWSISGSANTSPDKWDFQKANFKRSSMRSWPQVMPSQKAKVI